MPKIKQEDDFEDEEEQDEEFEEDEEEDELERKPKKRGPKPKQVKRRFGIVAPQSIKIVDVETNEVIGDGEFAVIQALTDILERLERIEAQIGAITSG